MLIVIEVIATVMTLVGAENYNQMQQKKYGKLSS